MNGTRFQFYRNRLTDTRTCRGRTDTGVCPRATRSTTPEIVKLGRHTHTHTQPCVYVVTTNGQTGS